MILKRKYYVITGQGEFSVFYGLYNYGDSTPFVQGRGKMLTVEIPQTENKAYFSWKSALTPQNRKTTHKAGIIYFSINQTHNYKLHLRTTKKFVEEKIRNVVGLRGLVSKHQEDKFNQRDGKLILESKKGQNNIQ